MFIKIISGCVLLIFLVSIIACGDDSSSSGTPPDETVNAPDYTVSSATYTTGNGLIIEGTLTLENTGNTDGTGLTWKVYRSADTAIDVTDVVVDSDTVSALTSGSALSNISYYGTFPPATETYYLLITTEADDDGDNTNNTYTIGPINITPLFEENFEDGDITTGNVWTETTGYTTSFPLITDLGLSGGEKPDAGTNCILTSTGLTSWNDGVNIDLNNIAPTYISFYMRVDSDDKASIFHISESTGQQIIRINFGAGGVVFGNTESLDSETNVDTWYHIELKNIDWTNKTLDFYADNGTDSLSPIIREPFSPPSTASGIDILSLISTTTTGFDANAWFDEIIMY